jgi:antigen flippase
MVNEQVEIGLLLAIPGVLGTLALAPAVIQLFYSPQFVAQSVPILRWICLGMVLRVISWPMGFILLAKGEGRLFLITEVVGGILQLGLMWLGLRLWHLPGTGVAFFLLYVFYAAGIYLVVRRLSGFRWSAANRRLALVFVPVTVAVFVAWYFLPTLLAGAVGLLATLGVGVYSLKTLCTMVSLNRLPRGLVKILVRLRLAPEHD